MTGEALRICKKINSIITLPENPTLYSRVEKLYTERNPKNNRGIILSEREIECEKELERQRAGVRMAWTERELEWD